ncbi:MAG: TonB family protein [Dolichospermum sp. DEX189]|jgi:TonB family protein|uniref:TonB family protein n=1 Tax=Aphanizomenon flos-aquae FACHB-1040 TaxID=2692887 RepID=A0ABR8BWU0_APHFL|nr:energy transducer TonB [Aphanizomenon flos-aquae]MBD2279106.1 TonB family protein [Aphanizomenon flos-aquae FACHB-1040]MBO1071428.1 TonB family protein [Dolichospermum sp. DEX189]
MSLSGITIEQREKEAEALKTFLIFSFIGSLALHTGLLALAINKFFFKVPEVTNEPIEVTILETLPQKIIQPPVEIKSLAKINSGGGNEGGEVSIPTKTTISKIKSSVAPVSTQPQPKTTNNLISKQSPILTPPKSAIIPNSLKNNSIENTTPEPTIATIPTETKPIQKLDETSNTLASTEPQAETKPTEIPLLKSEIQPNISSNNIPSNSTTSIPVSQNRNILNNLGNHRWRNILGKDSGNGVGNNSGNGVGNSSGNGVGNSSGNGVGNSSGNGVGNTAKPENTPVATAPNPPTENSSKLNRADCLQCQIKYPERARRRGAEGNPEVAIDTDNKGNVTRVRLIRSSGDSELDEAAQKAAQEWKLTPTEAGREGVRASVNFAIKGSQRHRKLQERQIEKQREAINKKPEQEAAASTSIESRQRNRRKTNVIITDIPSENITRQRQESAPSKSKPVSLPRQSIEPEQPKQTEESPARRRSVQPVKSDTSNQSDEGRTERIQKSQRRLTEVLRRRQKSADSPPAESPAPLEPATTSPTESKSQ